MNLQDLLIRCIIVGPHVGHVIGLRQRFLFTDGVKQLLWGVAVGTAFRSRVVEGIFETKGISWSGVEIPMLWPGPTQPARRLFLVVKQTRAFGGVPAEKEK